MGQGRSSGHYALGLRELALISTLILSYVYQEGNLVEHSGVCYTSREVELMLNSL